MGAIAGARTRLLHERDDAIDAVLDLAHRTGTDGGWVASIQAPAGMGKTSLIAACREELAASGFRVLSAGGSDLERDHPFGIVRQLLQSVLRDEQTRVAVLDGAAAAADVLFLGGQTRDQGSGTGVEPFEVLHALYWAFTNLCDLGPVIAFVDDVHEADAPSLRFLSFLARRLVDLPLLLVVASRPMPDGSAPAWDVGGAPVHDIRLAPLTSSAIAAIIEEELGSTPVSDVVDACQHATGGVPFFVRELARAARAAGDGGTVSLISTALGPEVIVQQILSRVASMPAAALPVARACAVLGPGGRLSVYAELAQVSIDDAAIAADALVREGIFAPGPDVAFLHPILQAAVLADLGDHSRRRWHERAAHVLDRAGAEASEVAAHLLRADPGGDDHMRDVLMRAARIAARKGSPAPAARLLRRAREECPGEAPAALLFELGVAEASLGRPDGVELMAEGVRHTPQGEERAQRALRLANFQMRAGAQLAAFEILALAREGLEPGSDLLLEVDATRYWAGRLHPDSRDEAMRIGHRLRTDASGRDTRAQRAVLAYLGCEAAQTESATVAQQYLRKALAEPGLLALLPFDTVAVQATLLSLLSIERLEEFDRLADDVLRAAGERGMLLAFLVVSTFRAMALLGTGDLAGAETEASEALRSATAQGWEHGAVGLVALQARALLEQGAHDEAASVLAAAAKMHAPQGFPTALLRTAQGKLAASTGDRAAAAAAFIECGRTLDAMRVSSPGVLPWRSELARLLVDDGELERARGLAQTELELARTLAGPAATARALHVLALTYERPQRVALLRNAREILVGSRALLTHAAVTVELGVTLRHLREAADARTFLTEGHALAAQCRCAPMVTRAREELAMLGVAPRRASAFGPEALTPGEKRVARLAAQGKSNAEIAQHLFVTRKTIEKHLASAYRKLGIESRTQLADAIEP